MVVPKYHALPTYAVYRLVHLFLKDDHPWALVPTFPLKKWADGRTQYSIDTDWIVWVALAAFAAFFVAKITN